MALLESSSLLIIPSLAFLCFFLIWFPTFLYCWNIFKRGQHADPSPTCWPVVGMLPSLIHNYHRLHEFANDVLKHAGGSYYFKGPWFGNSDFLITSDPANIHHILSRNFGNYPKGPKFRKIFDVLGDGIFNADSEIWETHRKTTMSLFNHARFGELLMQTTWDKVENGLLLVMDTFLAPSAAGNLHKPTRIAGLITLAWSELLVLTNTEPNLILNQLVIAVTNKLEHTQQNTLCCYKLSTHTLTGCWRSVVQLLGWSADVSTSVASTALICS